MFHHGSCGVSRCHTAYSFVQTAFCLQMIIAVSLWSGSKTLVSAILSILDPHQNSSQLSCSPVSWKSYSLGSAELALHALQQFIDEIDIGVGQLRAQDQGLRRSWISLPTLLNLNHQGQLFYFAQARREAGLS